MIKIEVKNHDALSVAVSMEVDGPNVQVVGELIEVAATSLKTICEMTGATPLAAITSVVSAMNRPSEATLVN